MAYEKSCEWCVYRDKKNPDICKNCSINETKRAKFELGKVDTWELAKGLNKDKPKDNIVKETGHYKLLVCPDCHKPSLFYDKHNGKKECFNRKCPSNSLSKYLTDKLLHSD